MLFCYYYYYYYYLELDPPFGPITLPLYQLPFPSVPGLVSCPGLQLLASSRREPQHFHLSPLCPWEPRAAGVQWEETVSILSPFSKHFWTQPDMGTVVFPGSDSGVGTPLLVPTVPDAHSRGRPPWALILTLRKVPIVHFQSCFKVTLISKLLAALAGDYSCINQGEIMPVTD